MPSDSPADVQLILPARSRNVAVVRHVAGAVAASAGLSAHVRDNVRLAVSEACTNVVRHAYADEEGPMVVSMRATPRALDVKVCDRGRGIAPTPRESAGLGLPLLAALSERLEVDHGGEG